MHGLGARLVPLLAAVSLAVVHMLVGCRAFADYVYDLYIENYSVQAISFQVQDTPIQLRAIAPCSVGHRSFMAGGAGYPVDFPLQVLDAEGRVLQVQPVAFGESVDGVKPYVVVTYRPDSRLTCPALVHGTYDVLVENTGELGQLRVYFADRSTPLLAPGESYRLDGMGGSIYGARQAPPIHVENALSIPLVRYEDYGAILTLPDCSMNEVPLLRVEVWQYTDHGADG